MANRHRNLNPKRVQCFLALIALAISFTAVAGRAQTVSNQDAQSSFREWSLLPRPPLLLAAPRPNAQLLTQPTTQGPRAETATAPLKPSTIAALEYQPADQGLVPAAPYGAIWQGAPQAVAALREPVLPSLLTRPPLLLTVPRQNGQLVTQRTAQRPRAETATAPPEPSTVASLGKLTDQEPGLPVAYAAVWERASQAVTALKAQLAFSSLLPQTLLSPVVWAGESQPVAEQVQNQTSGSGQFVKSNLLEAKILPGPAVSPAAADQSPAAARSGAKLAGEQLQKRKDEARTETETGVLARAADSKSSAEGTALGSVASSTPKVAGQPADQPIALNIGRGLRDPFKLPPPPRPSPVAGDWGLDVSRPPGVRGLLVPQLKLKGVVRDNATQKMIAVVTNSSNRAYFLREGEAVYNAVVSKITPDAVYFKENVFDERRQVHFREVVKTLNPAVGEAR